MANLTEHVMINKWDNDINDAIIAVGGNTTGSTGLPDYAKIIKEQLVAKGTTPTPEGGKEFILEGDTCIIKADENGYDEYNTDYAKGTKTGLNPGVLYLRICTAVKDTEPVYVDLTPIITGSVDVDAVVNEILKSPLFIELQQQIDQIQQDIVDEEDVTVIINKEIESTKYSLTEEEINSIINK